MTICTPRGAALQVAVKVLDNMTHDSADSNTDLPLEAVLGLRLSHPHLVSGERAAGG
jgi:hypothetical protein